MIIASLVAIGIGVIYCALAIWFLSDDDSTPKDGW